jgi:prepilin-type N-terminal cleavage/methylation domain-containing protein
MKTPVYRGFTLIELLLVITIITILIGTSVPSFWRTYDRIQLDNQSQNIAKVIEYVQEKAKVEQRVYKILFDQNRNRYYVEGSEYPSIYGFAGRREVQQDKETYIIPEGISVEATCEEIPFYPDGSVEKAKLILKKSYQAVTVTVHSDGGVRIEK